MQEHLKTREQLLRTLGSYHACHNESEKTKKYVEIQFLCLDLGIDFDELMAKNRVKKIADDSLFVEKIGSKNEDDFSEEQKCLYCDTPLLGKRQEAKFCSPKHKALYHKKNK